MYACKFRYKYANVNKALKFVRGIALIEYQNHLNAAINFLYFNWKNNFFFNIIYFCT